MTQEKTHTPGPWVVFDPNDKERTYGIDSINYGSVVMYGNDVNNGIRTLANAKLISAAPELLAALIYLRDCIETGKEPGMGIVHSAIKKAGGKP